MRSFVGSKYKEMKTSVTANTILQKFYEFVTTIFPKTSFGTEGFNIFTQSHTISQVQYLKNKDRK